MGLLWFVLILGAIVLIHEFGHFIFSKMFGVWVYEFSIGMGPKLFHYKKKDGETEYCIRAIPIGGFVSLAGEDDDNNKNIDESRKLYSKPVWKRFLIMVAGVMNNFIFAFLLLFVMALIYGSSTSTLEVSSVEKGMPAEVGGINKGDIIISIDDEKVSNLSEIQLYIQTSEGKKMKFKIKDANGNQREVMLIPEKITDDMGKDRFVVGISLDTKINKGFVSSIKYAGSTTLNLYKLMFTTIKQLFNGRASVRDLSGPVGIYTIVSEESKAGFQNILYLTAYLSINVGFINLLPFPAFDGGRVVFLIIEKIRRKRVPVKIEAVVNGTGFILLILLMLFVTFNDILRLL